MKWLIFSLALLLLDLVGGPSPKDLKPEPFTHSEAMEILAGRVYDGLACENFTIIDSVKITKVNWRGDHYEFNGNYFSDHSLQGGIKTCFDGTATADTLDQEYTLVIDFVSYSTGSNRKRMNPICMN